MFKALKVTSIVAIVIAGLGILGSLGTSGEDAYYELLGGAMFGGYGVVGLIAAQKALRITQK